MQLLVAVMYTTNCSALQNRTSDRYIQVTTEMLHLPLLIMLHATKVSIFLGINMRCMLLHAAKEYRHGRGDPRTAQHSTAHPAAPARHCVACHDM